MTDYIPHLMKKLLQSKEAALFWKTSWSNLAVPEGPLFSIKHSESLTETSIAAQKIAINLAGFWALLPGLAYYQKMNFISPHSLLKSLNRIEITDEKANQFCHFANCTWKVTQPFRGINRISRPVFQPYSMLGFDEKRKDLVQIGQAADLILENIPGLQDIPAEQQLEVILNQAHQPSFLLQMATGLFEAYYKNLGEAIPPFMEQEDWERPSVLPPEEEFLAASLTGFYVLECFVDLLELQTVNNVKVFLKNIQNQQLSPKQFELLKLVATAGIQTGNSFYTNAGPFIYPSVFPFQESRNQNPDLQTWLSLSAKIFEDMLSFKF